MSRAFPWEFHPDLTEDRLTQVGAWIARGRHDAVDNHLPEIGDDAWVLGARAYAGGKYRIKKAHESGEHEWLEILIPTQKFTFLIGAVPVRFYKGAPDEPTTRTLRQSHAELRQLSLNFEVGIGRNDLKYRFAVDVDIDGSVASIVFVGLNGEHPECFWEVPMTVPVATIHTLSEHLAEGVDLPAPEVGIPSEEPNKKDGTSDI